LAHTVATHGSQLAWRAAPVAHTRCAQTAPLLLEPVEDDEAEVEELDDELLFEPPLPLDVEDALVEDALVEDALVEDAELAAAGLAAWPPVLEPDDAVPLPPAPSSPPRPKSSPPMFVPCAHPMATPRPTQTRTRDRRAMAEPPTRKVVP
jgi:hypothetical protein